MAKWYLEYFHFISQSCRFLSVGLLMCFISSAGQTYFIGIFGPEIRATFSLSHTQWGTYYLIGTLTSAVLIPWTGQLVDRIDLRYFTVAVIAGLSLACWSISFASSTVMIVMSIFLLRHFGQGLASHTGVTSMARYFNNNRGKAIALATSGFSLGEALLPFLAIFAIASLGWRTSYQLVACILLLLIPFFCGYLKGIQQGTQNTCKIKVARIIKTPLCIIPVDKY